MRVQQPDGIHHIAIMSADMKAQLTFFTQVMGFPLKGLFEMHGVPGGKHAFLEMGPESYFSVVELAGIDEIPSTVGITHAGTGAGKCAKGTMQHIAFRAAMPGRVDLWPLVEKAKDDREDDWKNPVDLITEENHFSRLARQIAEEIAALAQRKGLKLVIGYILRVHPSWMKFVEVGRTLGKPLVMRMNLNQQSSGAQWQVHHRCGTLPRRVAARPPAGAAQS